MLVHLCGPEAGFNAEIISAANDKDQAALVFKYVSQIVALSPTLRDILKVVGSTKRVTYVARMNVYRAISSEASTKHGGNPVVVIYDELAQSRNRVLFDTLETSQGAQPEPLFITISTQSNDPQHPLSQMIDDALSGADDAVVCHLYEVPEDADIFSEEVWGEANPALGDFRSLPDLRKYAERAKRLPSFENVFRNLYLNQRVSILSTLVSRSVWEGLKGEVAFEPGEDVVLALDYAQRLDLAALAMLSVSRGALKVFFWKPEDFLEEHGRRDRVNYGVWRKQGWMEHCPGNAIRPEFVSHKIGELHGSYRIIGMAYDRWRIDQIVADLDRCGLDASKEEGATIRLYPWGQGFVDMAPAVDAFEEAAVHGTFQHEGNPVLAWNMGNAIVTSDAAGNRKLDKEKSRLRIDGAVAATMAFGLRAKLEPTEGPSVYRTRGLITI